MTWTAQAPTEEGQYEWKRRNHFKVSPDLYVVFALPCNGIIEEVKTCRNKDYAIAHAEAIVGYEAVFVEHYRMQFVERLYESAEVDEDDQ